MADLETVNQSCSPHVSRQRNTQSKRRIQLGLMVLLFGAASACGGDPPKSSTLSSALTDMVSHEDLASTNGGRNIIRRDGYFAIPDGVTRVWVDVGAHLLETTLHAVQANPDLALIAIEPVIEAVKDWPSNERILGLPIALGRERGSMDFHVNFLVGASSLLPSDPEESAVSEVDIAATTIQVRKVPVLLLEDVLERIPPDIDIEFLKLDIQGVDLQVLKSAHEQLRRVWRVKTEVLIKTKGTYVGKGEDAPGTEAEFTTYMESMGFQFVRNWNIAPQRMWLDKEYVNIELARSQPEILQRNPDLQKSLGM